MPERNTLPDQQDLFEKELDARLQSWRASPPRDYLKSRIATAVQETGPPPRLFFWNWSHSLTAGACALIAGVAFLCYRLQSHPSFAEVEKAMGSVQFLTFRSSSDHTMGDGCVQHYVTDTWVRRQPPAVAEHLVMRVEAKEPSHVGMEVRERRLRDAKQLVVLDELLGERKAPKSSKEDFAKGVQLQLSTLTYPFSDLPKNATTILSPWQSTNDVWNGKPVWIFTRTLRLKAPNKLWGEEEITGTVRIWADAKTHRIIRSESVMQSGNNGVPKQTVNTDFRYNEPPPAGTFELKKPKKTSAKKVKK